MGDFVFEDCALTTSVGFLFLLDDRSLEDVDSDRDLARLFLLFSGVFSNVLLVVSLLTSGIFSLVSILSFS